MINCKDVDQEQNYIDFSDGFKGDDHVLVYLKTALALAQKSPLPSKKIVFYSVFNTPDYFKSLMKIFNKVDSIKIQVSGESYHRTDIDFDLNLIHEKTNIQMKIVFFPYFTWMAYSNNLWHLLKNRPFIPKTKFCLFVVSNGNCPVRNIFFKKLNAIKKVDSCGKFLNNTGINPPKDIIEYLNFISQYKFMICFENQQVDYYLTEKLLNAYAGNSIPIYYGAPNVLKWFNEESFLYLKNSFESNMDDIINLILSIDRSESLYKRVHSKNLIENIPEELDINQIVKKSKKVLSI